MDSFCIWIFYKRKVCAASRVPSAPTYLTKKVTVAFLEDTNFCLDEIRKGVKYESLTAASRKVTITFLKLLSCSFMFSQAETVRVR